MASYFEKKGSSYYYIKVKRNGKWVPESTLIRKDAPNALRKIKKLVADECSKELSGPSKGSGWDWVPSWIRTTYQENTLVRYTNAWTAIDCYLELNDIRGPEVVTYKLCRAYPTWRESVDKKILKPCNWNTAITEIKVLSVIMQEAVRQEIIAANPCLRLGLKRRNVKKKKEITTSQQQIVEAALSLPTAKKWMRDSWIVAMTQGFRLSATAVPLADIDLTLNVVSVTSKKKVHTAPLHPEVRKLAVVAIEEGRTVLVDFPPSPAKMWWKFFRKLGLKDLSFHSTRVTVTTRLARAGRSKQQTMAYVGHASETVHDVYTRLSAPDVAHLGSALQTSFSENPKA
jgi:integrase